jgi:hypothetical protein
VADDASRCWASSPCGHQPRVTLDSIEGSADAWGRTSTRIVRSASDFCVRTVSHTLETLGQHRHLRGTHRCTSLLREVVNRKCVGGIRCASARVNGINFQASSIDHSDNSPPENQRVASGLSAPRPYFARLSEPDARGYPALEGRAGDARCRLERSEEHRLTGSFTNAARFENWPVVGVPPCMTCRSNEGLRTEDEATSRGLGQPLHAHKDGAATDATEYQGDNAAASL